MRAILAGTMLPLVLLLVAAACGAPTPSRSFDVLVVRHAEAWSNLDPQQREGRNASEADSLTPKGVAQAQALAASIGNIEVGAVFHSPSGRASETARILADHCQAPMIRLEALSPMQDGESVEAAAERARTALVARGEAGAWIVVSHSGVTAALIGEAEGVASKDRLVTCKLATGGLKLLRLRGARFEGVR